MAGSKKVLRIGVIAEEQNDVDVLYEYTAKILDESRFTFMKFVGHGCGALRRKCRAWGANLISRGCECIVIVHDSDGQNASDIYDSLRVSIGLEIAAVAVVLVPIEEVEAWLLADPNAIMTVFNMKKMPRIPSKTESINNPKEYLAQIVASGSISRYLNTVHNRRIAKEQSIATLDRCPSFLPYSDYLAQFKKLLKSQQKR